MSTTARRQHFLLESDQTHAQWSAWCDWLRVQPGPKTVYVRQSQQHQVEGLPEGSHKVVMKDVFFESMKRKSNIGRVNLDAWVMPQEEKKENVLVALEKKPEIPAWLPIEAVECWKEWKEDPTVLQESALKRLLQSIVWSPSNTPVWEGLRGIDGVVWINMDRSVERRVNMEKFWSHLNWLPAKQRARISAITPDTPGCREEVIRLAKEAKRQTTEICCTLSHIKAITSLQHLKGQWFLVCEDDVDFVAGRLLKHDLRDVVRGAPPEAQIIKVHTTGLSRGQMSKSMVLFQDWKKTRSASTVAYLINRSGINALGALCEVTAENEWIWKKEKPEKLHVADVFLYSQVRTFEYRYNFLDTRNEDSTIHASHLTSHRRSQVARFEALVHDLLHHPEKMLRSAG